MALLTLSRNDSRLVDLPNVWSVKNRREQLQKAAAESFSNLIAIAVADSNTNFELYDALRPIEEQKSIFFDRYRKTSWGSKRNSSDRIYRGAIWRKVKGANAASPGYSNHGSGLAIDLHPGPIQEVFKAKGPEWGWSWEEGRDNREAWHFVFVGGNRYASRGWLDHAAVQKAVGAEVDGKIGVGTVAKIKEWQKAHGLEADGIVGPGTKKAMFGAEDTPLPEKPNTPIVEDFVPDTTTLVPAVNGVFPWADSKTQAFDSKYPGQTYKGGTPKGLLHSTETGTWPGYSNGSVAPHITVRFDISDKTIEVRQHFSIDRPSRALANQSGGVQTNNWSVFQAELIGSCDRAFSDKHGYPYLPDLLKEDWARDALAAVIASVSKSLDIPIQTSVSWAKYPGSYGINASQRLSDSAWNDYQGWLGHQHAPENDHGDPGDIPIESILSVAKGGGAVVIDNGNSKPATPSTGSTKLPTGKALLMALISAPDFPLLRTPGHQCYYGSPDGPIESVSGKNANSLNPGEIFEDGGKTRSQGLYTIQRQLVKRGYDIDVDGRWGPQMDNSIDNIQKLAGLTRDKKCGPDTWYTVWLLPVT